MSIKIKSKNKSSKVLKLELKDGKKVYGRAFLYIIKNDLHKQSYGYLEDLYVVEKFRGKGYGRVLLKEAIKKAKKLKLYKLVGTSRSSRKEVHKFYQKYGFKKYGFEFRMDL